MGEGGLAVREALNVNTLSLIQYSMVTNAADTTLAECVSAKAGTVLPARCC